MSVPEVREAYAARAAEYISLFGSIGAAAEHDREHILGWARGINGQIIDVGCGPGQWTNYLSKRGVDIDGVDPVPEFTRPLGSDIPASPTGSVMRIASASRTLAWEESSPGTH
ncbi:methyltransferase domain-containing protein [Jiangella asiatica]|uniref:methyltransferase domain-containing protein n=1 Tax=Jiangella asiatica TaxID=2530372 RepID=UPI00193EB358|nr:class I SAM-dependent methyltransferase [Jiangella asiatica]